MGFERLEAGSNKKHHPEHIFQPNSLKPKISHKNQPRKLPLKTGIIKLPIFGADQAMQIYGNFDGFSLNSALFGLGA